MAILEAMSYGMPVIATRIGAIPEAVTDGVEACLIKPGDVGALADRMLRLSNDAGLRERMGQAARRRVAAEFGIEKAAEAILNIYGDVLGTQP